MACINTAMDSQKLLKKVATIIYRESSVFKDIEVVKGARVPVIKFREVESELEFDIIFNEHGGIAIL